MTTEPHSARALALGQARDHAAEAEPPTTVRPEAARHTRHASSDSATSETHPRLRRQPRRHVSPGAWRPSRRRRARCWLLGMTLAGRGPSTPNSRGSRHALAMEGEALNSQRHTQLHGAVEWSLNLVGAATSTRASAIVPAGSAGTATSFQERSDAGVDRTPFLRTSRNIRSLR